jgi:hypothetical protein
MKVFLILTSDELKSLIDEGNLPIRYGGSSKVDGYKNVGPWNDGSLAGFPKAEWEVDRDLVEE